MIYYEEGIFPPPPRPIQIISPKNHVFQTKDLYLIKDILDANALKDRDIVVVSIAGSLRKGKSFLLNYFLKYLNAQVCVQNFIEFR